MYFVYFDSGTSNTRMYLTADFKMVDSVKAALGSKDSAIAKDRNVLLRGLKDLYDILLAKNSLTDSDIKAIYASGMVTSPYGIFEVPHLVTPVDLEKLRQGIYLYHEANYFKRPIRLIRGIKTLTETGQADMDSLRNVNNLRGEETEVFGILSGCRDLQNFGVNLAIFLPGSHTHICYVKKGVIADCLATFTGELSYALSTATVLAGELEPFGEVVNEAMILKGYQALRENGICRALYMLHASKILNITDNEARRCYLEGIISGSVVDAFCQKLKSSWQDVQKIIIAGNKNYIVSYQIILNSVLDRIKTVILKQTDEAFSYQGFIAILKKEIGELCQGS
jgi:2-dehydro-3-deoxygalactonokinase